METPGWSGVGRGANFPEERGFHEPRSALAWYGYRAPPSCSLELAEWD